MVQNTRGGINVPGTKVNHDTRFIKLHDITPECDVFCSHIDTHIDCLKGSPAGIIPAGIIAKNRQDGRIASR